MLGAKSWEARYTNVANLFFMFVNEDANDAPIELEEVYLSFFDLDQTWADGTRGMVREAFLVPDYTRLFLSNTTSIETHFTSALGGNAKIPTFSATGLDANNLPTGYSASLRDGVVLRSTEQGTGGAQAEKSEWELCQGHCITNSAACSRSQYLSSSCSRGQACGPTGTPAPNWAWTGCGFSNTPPGTATGSGSGRWPAEASVPCGMDCPRTSVAYDDGNPTDPDNLTPQQGDRAFSILYRGRSNFSLSIMTQLGNDAGLSPNTALYAPGTFNGQPVSWP